MTPAVPSIDIRTANSIAKQVQNLIKIYAPAWQEFDPDTKRATGVSGALIGIFSRFSEIIIQRINQVPQKNFLAFLDLLGAAVLPPQPARVPLTFFLAAGSLVDGLVLAGTQVAAPPAESEKDPVIFETERELNVTAARLASLFTRDPDQDKQADLGSIIDVTAAGRPLFQGNQPVEHVFYIGHNRLLGFPQIADLRLTITLDSVSQDTRELEWEFWDGIQWQPRAPVSDDSQNLTTSGIIHFTGTAAIPENHVNATKNRWMRVRLVTPITISGDARLNMVRSEQLPRVREVLIEAHLTRSLSQGMSPEAAFTNAVEIDLGKDILPFGEKPKLNDAFYIASAEAFSKDSAQGLAETGALVQIDVRMSNSHLHPAVTSVRPSPDLELAWECWDGTKWQRVGTSIAPSWLRLLEVDPVPNIIVESTLTLQGRGAKGAAVKAEMRNVTGVAPQTTRIGEDGRFAFTLSPAIGLTVVTFTATLGSATDVAWVAFFRKNDEVNRNIELRVPSPPDPVGSSSITLIVSVGGSQANQVTHVRVTNGSNGSAQVTVPRGNPLVINLVEGRNELLIDGLSAQSPVAAVTLTISRKAAAQVESGTGFVDGTHAFCQDGIVRLTLPDKVASVSVNGKDNFWLRVRVVKGDYGKEAGYKLKNPAAADEGFALILESFRPPSVSELKIGYAQTLSGAPEVMLAYNNSSFSSVVNAQLVTDNAFEPFKRVPEDHPVFYIGFALPQERAVFPNRTISFYALVEDLKYGEQTIPISPEVSKKSGLRSSVVSHRFAVANAASAKATFSFGVFGTRWLPKPVSPAAIHLSSGESQEVEIQITIPADAPLGSSDRGFLKLESSAEPEIEYTADFVTFAGTEPETGERLRLVWEYWGGRQWSALTVRDDTENFTRPGLIEFLAPPDLTTIPEFGQERYWLRVRCEKGEYVRAPRLRRMLLNTTMAAQTVTLYNHILGSSDGSTKQKFRSTRTPILLRPNLEVREPEMPSSAELEIVISEEGESAITVVSDAVGRPKEIWVRWHEVPDFYSSGPRSRHYLLDHLTGEIRFGDGLNGLIPPAGIGNIRLARYQIGGGKAGNKPAGAIVQLKTTVPYVDKVTNTEDSAGGADAETLDSLLVRAPSAIRHGDRAVTREDYEDLAMLASPEVARAKCVSLRSLTEDSLGQQPVRGEVSVIIVPRSSEAKPQPSLELLSRVHDFLDARSVPTAHVSVVGPLYVRVEVKAEVAVVSLEGARAVEQGVQQKLAAFLHPLTGGHDRGGWDFGRKPHRSDLYALIEAVPGVDHVRSLTITETEDQAGVSATGRFLVFSGTHTTTLVFEEA
jgi:hypothetical protein